MYKIILSAALLLGGCATVAVEKTSTQSAIAEQRADILSAGRLSTTAVRILTQSDLTFDDCEREPLPCITRLEANKKNFSEIDRLDALTELWLARALQLDKKPNPEAVLNAYLNVSRHAYARLFVAQSPQSNVDHFDSQRLKIRDFYNMSAQRIGELYYQAYSADPTFAAQPYMKNVRVVAPIDLTSQPAPSQLISTADINFKDLRVRQRQEGVGAPFVAVFPSVSRGNDAIVNPGYVGVTAVFDYAGRTVDDVLAAPQANLEVIRSTELNVRHKKVAVAADFSAPIALWMSNSQFYRNAIKGLVSSKDSMTEPKLYMLEPFDPKRRVLVLLHGLASSPETWLNVANELMGDAQIRQGYQIWLVAYPTQLAVPINRTHIQQLINTTVQQFDPAQSSFASQHLVLAGHSMGGVISRLLVSDSGERFFKLFTAGGADLTEKERAQLKPAQPYLEFKAMPNVRRAIFVSAPHRGAPLAGKWYTQWIGSLVKLPVKAVSGVTKGMVGIGRVMTGRNLSNEAAQNPLSSISSLSDQDPWTLLAKDLPIVSHVVTHSIIGRVDESVALLDSSDGVVPYRSAHLDGTRSELLIKSDHFALDRPSTWTEIKRILHEELKP